VCAFKDGEHFFAFEHSQHGAGLAVAVGGQTNVRRQNVRELSGASAGDRRLECAQQLILCVDRRDMSDFSPVDVGAGSL